MFPPLARPLFVCMLPSEQPMSLTNLRVLIVEDEPLLVMDLEAALQAADAKTTSARSLTDAVALIDKGACDVCVADLNLWGEDAAPLIDCLKRKGVPFLTYSGYFSPPTGRVIAHVQKPKGAEAVVAELEARFG